MEDYTLFETWNCFHIAEMENVCYASKNDYFIFLRKKPSLLQEAGKKLVLHARTLREVYGYFRHCFLHDYVSTLIDNMYGIYEPLSCINRNEAMIMFRYWLDSEGALKNGIVNRRTFDKMCDSFNREFNPSDGFGYEFKLFKGISKFANFVCDLGTEVPYFDKESFKSRLFKSGVDFNYLQDTLKVILKRGE